MTAAAGFARFQSAIDGVAKAIGEPSLRAAIAKHFHTCLTLEMEAARGLSRYSRALPFGVDWTMATPAEFEAAAERGESTLRSATSSLAVSPTAEAVWRGTALRLHGDTIYAEGVGFRIKAVWCLKEYPRYDRRLRRNVDSWKITFDEDFLTSAMMERYSYSSSRAKTKHTQTRDAAVKAMRRLVKDFLGVDMVNV